MTIDTQKQHLVLSFGRSGSILLAQNLGKKLNSLPVYNKDKSLAPATLTHSHVIFDPREISEYHVYFSLRRDIKQTILSTVLSSHYNFHHRFADQTKPVMEPFVFQNWNDLKKICRGFTQWHTAYQAALGTDRWVIFLEDLLSRLPNPSEFYDETYPNKSELILNYDRVVAILDDLVPEMQTAMEPFVQHQNSLDIYQVFADSTGSSVTS